MPSKKLTIIKRHIEVRIYKRKKEDLKICFFLGQDLGHLGSFLFSWSKVCFLSFFLYKIPTSVYKVFPIFIIIQFEQQMANCMPSPYSLLTYSHPKSVRPVTPAARGAQFLRDKFLIK